MNRFILAILFLIALVSLEAQTTPGGGGITPNVQTTGFTRTLLDDASAADARATLGAAASTGGTMTNVILRGTVDLGASVQTVVNFDANSYIENSAGTEQWNFKGVDETKDTNTVLRQGDVTPGGSLTNVTLTGGTVSGQTNSALTASRVVVTAADKTLASGAATTAEVDFVAGVTSSIQTQIDSKVAKAGDTMTGTLTVTGLTNSALTASRAVVSGADKTLASSATTTTELGYVSGVTSAIQTQLGTKLTEANTLSEFNTTAERTSARSNLDVLWADDTMSRMANRMPRGGLRFTGAAADYLLHASAVNLGTNDFTISGTVSLVDYTPAITNVLFQTHSTGSNTVQVVVNTTGAWRLIFTDNTAVATAYDVTPDVALVDGETYSYAITADRDGNATLYFGGDSDRDNSGASVTVSIAAASAIDVGSGNGNAATEGYKVIGIIEGQRPYNRLLTAAEVLTLAKTGVVDFSDQWGAMTQLVTNTGFESDTSGYALVGSGSITRIITDASVGSASCEVVAAGASEGIRTDVTGGPANTDASQKYEVVFDAKSVSGNTTLTAYRGNGTGASSPIALTAGWVTYRVEVGPGSGSASTSVARLTLGGAGTFRIDNITIKKLGALLDPDFHNASPSLSLTVKDRSSNANDGTVQGTAANTVQVRKTQRINTSTITVGGGTEVNGIVLASAALNFDLTAVTFQDLTITLAGVGVNDTVALGIPNGSILDEVLYSAWISATNTVTVRAAKVSATARDPASGTFRATVFKY